MKPILNSLFAELTLLGFIGLLLFLVFRMEAVSELSVELLGEESELQELSEVVHMALFLVMVLFLATDLTLVYFGVQAERTWHDLEEQRLDKRQCDREQKILHKNIFVIGLHGQMAFGTAIGCKLGMHAFIRERFVTQEIEREEEVQIKSGKMASPSANGRRNTVVRELVKNMDEHFDFAEYLSARLGHILAEIVEVPIPTWAVLEVLILVWWQLYAHVDLLGQVIVFLAAGCCLPLAFVAVNWRLNYIKLAILAPELVDYDKEHGDSHAAAAEGANTQLDQTAGDYSTFGESLLQNVEMPAYLFAKLPKTLQELIRADHEHRFGKGGTEACLGQIRLVLLFNAIYVTMILMIYGGHLVTRISGNTDAGLGSMPAAVALMILAGACVPPMLCIALAPSVVENFAIVSSVESLKSRRSIERVIRRQKTLEAFQALKVVQIMRRPDILQAAKAELERAPERRASRVHDRGFSAKAEKERVTWERIFNLFDSGGDGTIETYELKSMFKNCCNDITEAHLNLIVEVLDTSGDGEVDFSEFHAFAAHLDALVQHMPTPITDEEIISDMFNTIDDDGSGEIQVAELAAWMVNIGQEITADDLFTLLADMSIDEDGSGAVDQEEFESLVKKLGIF